MRKITVIIALFILLPLWAAETGRYHSRGNAFEITVGGGYSSLGYKVNNVADQLASKTSGSYSLQVHIGYNWFFCEYAGLAVGADIQHYGQKATLNGLLTWSGVTDTDGEKYDHLLNLNNWTEQQNYWAVEIPVSFVFSFPVVQDKLYITAQVGGKYGIPLSAKYAGSGALTHSGYYAPWGLTLADKPNHGFYTEQGFTPKGTLPKKNYWTVFAKVGVAIPLVEHLDLLVQGYFNYALTAIGQSGSNVALGFRNDRPGQEEAHYFMQNYTDLSNTSVITGSFKPWSAGLEIGIRYTIPTKKTNKYPCRCLNNYWM